MRARARAWCRDLYIRIDGQYRPKHVVVSINVIKYTSVIKLCLTTYLLLVNRLMFVIETHCFLWAVSVIYNNCVLKTLSAVWVWCITGINLERECQTADGWLFMSGRNPFEKVSVNIFSSSYKVFMCSGAVGLGAAPQHGRFPDRLPLGPLEILKWLIISVCIQ